jgi:ribose transport system substrate-binding protein
VQVVESFASQGMDGIVLAPLDDKALVRPVEEAAKLKVPTVIMDSALASEQIVSFVAHRQLQGRPSSGADALGQAMNGKGKILLLRYAEGSASTTAAGAGFLDKLKSSWPGLELLSSPTSTRGPRATPPSARARTC